MSKKACKVVVSVFFIFIFSFALFALSLEDREFSEQENRYLKMAPKFSFSSLFSGEFTDDFESYMSDQFPLRDQWITMKARFELTSGKTMNNGVYYCGDGVLINKFDKPSKEQLDTNIKSLNALVEKTDCEVYFQLIPTSAEIWSDKLPAHAESADQAELIDHCYSSTSANTVDVVSVLAEHADEYIYYRTDHHWTTLGAYYGYTALAGAMGLNSPPPPDSYTRRTMSEDFYGTTYSSSGFSWVEPDTIEVFVDPGAAVKVTNYPKGSPEDGCVYDESFLEKKDKYAMFFGGNTPLLHVSTGKSDGSRLLILRDSYADCFTPFLFNDFSDIYLMDLRYYKTSLSAFISENNIDVILLCYSTNSFATDTSMFLLSQ